MIYFICFVISALLAHLASKATKRSGIVFLSFLSVATTVLLAGLRDISIGIDTSNYFYGSWSRAITSPSFRDFVLSYQEGDSVEILHLVIMGMVAKTIGNYNVYLIVVHLIIVGCFYIGAFRMRHHADPAFVLFVFYLLYFGHSLNIYRQYMAMSVVFMALADIEKRKHLRYLIFVVLGFLIHNTAVMGLGPLVLFRILYPKNKVNPNLWFRTFIALVLIIVGSYVFVPLVEVAIDSGTISDKYSYYLNDEEVGNYTMAILFLSVEIVGLLLTWKNFKKSNLSYFFLISFVSFLALYIMGQNIVYGKRIAAYFSFINIITLGKMIQCQPTQDLKNFVKISVIVVTFVFWCYVFVYRNANQTMPYRLMSGF